MLIIVIQVFFKKCDTLYFYNVKQSRMNFIDHIDVKIYFRISHSQFYKCIIHTCSTALMFYIIDKSILSL